MTLQTVKKFGLKVPAEIYRFIVLLVIGGLLTGAVITSRHQNIVTDVIEAKQKFQQPKNHQRAEGRFIPTPKALVS